MSTVKAQRAYIARLEREIGELQDKLLAYDDAAPPVVIGGDAVTVDVLDVVSFDLVSTKSEDVFLWKVGLPIGGVALSLHRREVRALCQSIIEAQHSILELLDDAA